MTRRRGPSDAQREPDRPDLRATDGHRIRFVDGYWVDDDGVKYMDPGAAAADHGDVYDERVADRLGIGEEDGGAVAD